MGTPADAAGESARIRGQYPVARFGGFRGEDTEVLLGDFRRKPPKPMQTVRSCHPAMDGHSVLLSIRLPKDHLTAAGCTGRHTARWGKPVNGSNDYHDNRIIRSSAAERTPLSESACEGCEIV